MFIDQEEKCKWQIVTVDESMNCKYLVEALFTDMNVSSTQSASMELRDCKFVWQEKVTIFFFPSQWRTQKFCSGGGGDSTNSVEDRGQRERGSGGGSPLVMGFWRQL